MCGFPEVPCHQEHNLHFTQDSPVAFHVKSWNYSGWKQSLEITRSYSFFKVLSIFSLFFGICGVQHYFSQIHSQQLQNFIPVTFLPSCSTGRMSVNGIISICCSSAQPYIYLYLFSKPGSLCGLRVEDMKNLVVLSLYILT